MMRVIIPATIPRKLAMVITATSRWATWDSSWARTASSSDSSSRRISPVVAQTTALFGLRPVAKALGTSVSATATRGFFMSARAQRRSMTPCNWGACSGVTTWPPMPNRAILSENQYWTKSRAAASTRTTAYEMPTAIRSPTTAPYSTTSKRPVVNIRMVSP